MDQRARPDVGPSAAFAENARITVTVALKLRAADQIDRLIESVYTPGSPQYRQFLTPDEFRSQFGPSAASVAAVTREFEAQGLTVTRSASAQLHVNGSAAQIEKAFAVELHTFEVAATTTTSAYRYPAARRPARAGGDRRRGAGSTRSRFAAATVATPAPPAANGFEIEQAGGTSFVAPELNGVASLFVDALHHRIGLLNPALYAIAGSAGAYHGHGAPLRGIKHGDNWYWHAHAGYKQATGVGVPDVANLLEALETLEY